jgi:predicted metal-dependent phosphoesterase TrpH
MRLLLHAHSKWSHDGVLALNEWPAVARAAGCDAVLLSEHEESGWNAPRYDDYVRACADSSRDGVTLVAGIEFEQHGYHLLCYGLRAWPRRPSSAAALAAAVREQGCSLCLAHPGKYRWRFPDSILAAVEGVEVWNSKWIYDGIVGPHPRSLALASNKRLLAGQDVHKTAHVANVFVDIDGDDVQGALSRGDYRIVRGAKTWRPEALRRWQFAPAVQRSRTATMRTALRGYRLLRDLRGTGHA